MEDRVPGPVPPGAPGTPARPPRPPPEEPEDWLDEDPAGDGDLFERSWPDDDELPQVPDPEPEVLSAPVPLVTDDEDDLALAEDPSIALTDLEDLTAAEDTDIPVIDSALSVKLDGRSLPARVDWVRPTTVWVRPSGAGPERDVWLEIAGRRIQCRVLVLEGDQELVLLGRDLLKGRFLLRA